MVMFKAEASVVRLFAKAVVEIGGGMVRTVSMTWTTPPSNVKSWFANQ